MALLANQSAYDFGYICAGEFLQRTDNTLAAMEKLERYRGHFYNWYDTQTLQPLHPLYVSSVDSGNLAGSLLTLEGGLLELKEESVLPANAFHGLQDTLQVLAEHVPELSAPDLAQKIKVLQSTVDSLVPAAASSSIQPETLAGADHVLEEIHRIGGSLVAWLPADIDIDGELYYWAQAFDRQSCALRDEFASTGPRSTPFQQHPDTG